MGFSTRAGLYDASITLHNKRGRAGVDHAQACFQRVCEVAVKGEGPGNLSLDEPVNQLTAQRGVILESREPLFLCRRRLKAALVSLKLDTQGPTITQREFVNPLRWSIQGALTEY
ncbi:MAG: hypothetical protein ACKVX9_15370 [Blastocatellia bacterium]